MLSKLFIQNFALIDQLTVEFHSGLEVITGETGAGKSIILGALRLLQGERVDTKSIADSSKKSIVEGAFKVQNSKFQRLLKENDLDFETETIIRREISASGKSRAFINDTPVNLNVLKDISENLIDIHSQFETSNLFLESYQIGILDGIAGNQKLFEEYQNDFRSLSEAKTKLQKLKSELAERNKESDYHQYLLNELQESQLENVDFEELQSQLATLENAGLIKEQLSASLELLGQENVGVLEVLHQIRTHLGQITRLASSYEELLKRVESVNIELQDIEQSIAGEYDGVSDDPEIVAELTTKINTINNLLVKHQVLDVEDLLLIQRNLEKEKNSTTQLEEDIENIEQLIDNQQSIVAKKAIQLSEKRKPAISIFERKSGMILKQLGLEKANLKIEMLKANALDEFGIDKIQMLFQANAGYPLQSIKNAISGGERSRVMFAIKKIMAESQELPTLILDEIDTGISGRIADEMGVLMKEMGQKLQLIVITHLAQIAAKGSNNYRVFKTEIEGKTQSTITVLNEDEKINEIAQLLSGHKVTNAALQQAKELIG